MAFKVILYGSVSLITIVAGLASLGSLLNLLNQATEGIDYHRLTAGNIFCTTNSDCKQDPNNCIKCVNIMAGGFTLLSKCGDKPMPCYCINNECTNSTSGLA